MPALPISYVQNGPVVRPVRFGPSTGDIRQDLVKALTKVMRKQAVSQADLARRLGRWPTHVTRLLDPTRHTTPQSFEEAFWVLDYRLVLGVVPKKRV